jgi:hypothetical protein
VISGSICSGILTLRASITSEINGSVLNQRMKPEIIRGLSGILKL